MDKETVDKIKNLAQTKSCILVHFGNPLALKHLGDLADFEAVICGYQAFEEAQEVASHFF